MKLRNPLPTEAWKQVGIRLGVVAGLAVLWLGGVALRSASYEEFYSHDAPFFLESAQHFRNVQLVATGPGIPDVDVDLEHPDGLITHSHTILGETLVGWGWRVLPWDELGRFTRTHAVFGVYLSDLAGPLLPQGEDGLHAYVRQSVRYSMAFLVVPIYLGVSFLSGRRFHGFVAAALYAVAYAAVERSTGWEFFHEHTAFPFLGLHLYFTLRALRTGKWGDVAGSFLFLWIALLCWKVIQFYFLTLIAWFALAFVLGRLDRQQRRLLLAYCLGFLVVSLLFETHLRYNRFWFSKPLLACYAILGTGFVTARFGKEGHAWRVGIFAGLLGGLLLLTTALGQWMPPTSLLNPAASRYGHVWETFFAILRYGTKPADPSLLSFDARHYWGAPNTPPSVVRFLSLYGLLLPLAGAAVVRIFLAWRRGTNENRRPDSSVWLLLFLLASFLGFYLLFYKMTSFLALFTAVAIGLGAAFFAGRASRATYLVLSGLVIAACLVQSLDPRGFVLTRQLVKSGLETSHEKRYQNVVRPECVPRLLDWIEAKTDPNAVFLSEFVLSPTLLVYGDRPINQNPFFESRMRDKYRMFAEGLFQSEEEFYELCRTWDTDYFVYNAHMLLRRDPYMSYRYVANEMGWSEDWAAYRFHFNPERLEHFTLVYQNACFRVYRVLQPGQTPRSEGGPTPRVFDVERFESTVERDADGRLETGEWFRRVLGVG